jgi:hypothetical protein
MDADGWGRGAPPGSNCAKRSQFFDFGLRIVDCGLETGLRPEPIVRNEPNLPQVSGNGCGWLGPGGSAGEQLCEAKPISAGVEKRSPNGLGGRALP